MAEQRSGQSGPRPGVRIGLTGKGANPALSPSIGLSAVIVSVASDVPRVLTIRIRGQRGDALPSGPLEPEHRTLERGLRNWVERQTRQTLGYAEQLYTFGDRDRADSASASGEEPISGNASPDAALTVAYLALVRQDPAGSMAAAERSRASGEEQGAGNAAIWQSWYRFLPWEDWRDGRPAALARLDGALTRWIAGSSNAAERRSRGERVALAFGTAERSWNEESALERYELLYEAGLVREARRQRLEPVEEGAPGGDEMAFDHRRILATAVARLRGKIKYRPVIFELMPPAFTLFQLQKTVEALAGIRLHKQNFRRVVEQQGLVEETGTSSMDTGGRPARLVRFRREVLLERPAPGVRLRAGRRTARERPS